MILPTLEANLYKLKSKHRMKNNDIQHDNTQSTYRQLNKRLIEDTHMTNYHHPYYSLILSDFYLFPELTKMIFMNINVCYQGNGWGLIQ